MKVRVDQDKCIGCGLCTSVAENVFSFNDDGKAQASNVAPDDEEAVESAISSCPVEAISKE